MLNNAVDSIIKDRKDLVYYVAGKNLQIVGNVQHTKWFRSQIKRELVLDFEVLRRNKIDRIAEELGK